MVRTSVLAGATQVDPSAVDREVFAAAGRVSPDEARVILKTANGSEVLLPVELVRILVASASELASGHSVTVLASEAQLTPAEAATLLGLSRPFVARLLDSGDIPSEYLPGSRHRVVRLADVLAFQERRGRRREGRRQIAEAMEAAGLSEP
ncbi:helix-turn-helix domain-containing protein [Streptomyces beijiangensis]|uniref:Helix-turn-helix domain-containing protein n=1 Tax=Streptomyces beijiangensis TaxID=163361 RepID=A0A939FD99_9ACTN|nr:helix-turn-helix domain-containing protein [Streptomyces beijiangensis]MBO0516523.1 helix-turn-helix domain-containing protein [Streptomyces beijiangensis]